MAVSGPNQFDPAFFAVGADGTVAVKAAPTVHGLLINGTATQPQPITANALEVIASETAALLLLDSYGTAAPQVFGRRSRGTAAAPTAVQSGDVLLQIGTQGRGATAYSTTGGGAANFTANENWSDTAQGTTLTFWTTPAGTVAQHNSLTLAGDTATFSGTFTACGGNILTAADGAMTIGSAFVIGQGVSTGGCGIEVGGGRTGDGVAYVDFHGTAASDFDFRILRNAGVNGAASLSNTGSGSLTFSTAGANSLVLNGNTATFSGDVTLPGTVHLNGALMQADASYFHSILGAGQPTGFLWQAPSTAALMGLDASATTGALTVYSSAATNAVKPGGGTWAAPSARELKTDIAPYDDGLEAVLALSPVRYRYSGAGGLAPDGGVHVGLIAEDCAHMSDLHGSATLPDGEAYATLNHTPLTFALINAVKELAARLTALEGV